MNNIGPWRGVYNVKPTTVFFSGELDGVRLSGGERVVEKRGDSWENKNTKETINQTFK